MVARWLVARFPGGEMTGYPVFFGMVVNLSTVVTNVVTRVFFFVVISFVANVTIITTRQEGGHTGDDIEVIVVII